MLSLRLLGVYMNSCVCYLVKKMPSFHYRLIAFVFIESCKVIVSLAAFVRYVGPIEKSFLTKIDINDKKKIVLTWKQWETYTVHFMILKFHTEARITHTWHCTGRLKYHTLLGICLYGLPTSINWVAARGRTFSRSISRSP